MTPVIDTVADAAPFAVSGTNNGDQVTIADVLPLASPQLAKISEASGNFEALSFANKSQVVFSEGSGGNTISVNLPAQPAGLTSLTINSGTGSNEVDVAATPTGVATAINQEGNPSRTVIGSTLAKFNTGLGNLAKILGTVQVTNASPGELYVDDSSRTLHDTVTLTSTTISTSGPPAIANITYDNTFDQVQLALTSGADTVNVQSTQSGAAP